MAAIKTLAPQLNVPAAFEPLIEGFLDWVRVERGFSTETISTYRRSVSRFVTEAGVATLETIDLAAVVRIKRSLMNRGCSPAYIAGILLAMRCFIGYCRHVLNLSVIEPAIISPPARPRRRVTFLTSEEVHRFVNSIPLGKRWLGHCRVRMVNEQGLLYRALVEALLGSGMRISEVLSLKRSTIDWVQQEARVVGKGGKERAVFFTARAVYWLRRYLDTRTDHNDGLFVRVGGRMALSRHLVGQWFRRQSRRAGLNKTVTAHVLRHTVATTLMFNGCPIGHIKEILGHERLDTTCRYYLGLDTRQAKAAMLKSLSYDVSQPEIDRSKL